MRIVPLSLVAGSCLIAVASAQFTTGRPSITPQPSLGETSAMIFVSDVQVGAERGRMELHYNPKRSGAVTGSLLGERVAGYYYTGAAAGPHSLALLRYRTPPGGASPADDIVVQALTADSDSSTKQWIGSAHWLVSGPDAGSTAINALGFRTVPVLRLSQRRFCPRGQTCPPPPDPQLPAPPTANTPVIIADGSTNGFGLAANLGPLIVREKADSNNEVDNTVTGHVVGEQITGHYAESQGTIAFLRLRNGVPIQIWHGALDQNGVSGGRVLPLSADGGAPTNWEVSARDQIGASVRSTEQRDRCLVIADANPQGNNNFFLTTSQCVRDANEWVLFAVSAIDPVFTIVSAATGYCVTAPAVSGAIMSQAVCNGSPRQTFRIRQSEFQVGDIGQAWLDVVGTMVAAEFTTASRAQLLKPLSGGCMLIANISYVYEPVLGDCKTTSAGWTGRQ